MKLPVLHKGCVKEADGAKYVSIHFCWMLGRAVHNVWMIPVIWDAGRV